MVQSRRMTPEEKALTHAARYGVSGRNLFSLRPSTDPRDPRSDADMIGRHPIFRNHNCYRCKDGEKSCVKGNPRNCDFLHARND